MYQYNARAYTCIEVCSSWHDSVNYSEENRITYLIQHVKIPLSLIVFNDFFVNKLKKKNKNHKI